MVHLCLHKFWNQILNIQSLNAKKMKQANMDWNKLLSQNRLRKTTRTHNELDQRNEFESDFGRIIFSPALRYPYMLDRLVRGALCFVILLI